jgi:hypothetical protein
MIPTIINYMESSTALVLAQYFIAFSVIIVTVAEHLANVENSTLTTALIGAMKSESLKYRLIGGMAGYFVFGMVNAPM